MPLVTLPYDLEANTLASASEVMGNFNALEDTLNGNIEAVNLADSSVSSGKLQDSAVTEGKINDGAVTEGKIGTGAVTATKIGTGAVTEAKIGSAAVTTAKIADGDVTSAKLASGVALANIGAGGVTATYLASDSVTTAKIDDEAVTPAKTSFFDATSASAKIYFGEIDNTSGTEIQLPTGWSVTSNDPGTGSTHITHNLGTTSYGVIAQTPSVTAVVGVSRTSTTMTLTMRKHADLTPYIGRCMFMVVLY